MAPYDTVKIRLNCFTTMLQVRSTVYDHRCRQRCAKRAAFAFITSASDISISFVSSSRPRSVCDSLFLTLSIVALCLGNVKCINATLNASKRAKESNRLQSWRLHLDSKCPFMKIHKMSINDEYYLSFWWSDIWSDPIMSTNNYRLPVCQRSYLIVRLKLCQHSRLCQ